MKLKDFKWKNVLFIAAMFVVVVLLLDLSSRLEELDMLSSQLELVEAEGTAVMATQNGLLTQIAYVTSDAAVARWAYVEGKWVRDGETLVEIVPQGTPQATPVAALPDQPEELPNWRLWWELFFGDTP